MRLDVYLTENGIIKSRTQAQMLIKNGSVTVDGKVITKPSFEVDGNDVVCDTSCICPYVSRGGLKLKAALDSFKVLPSGFVCLDIGASTGGFTDCMLQHGAKHVYSIDVGYGQLDWSLRNDPRVTVMERTNARYMEEEWFQEAPSFASIDVSFISLQLMLPPLYDCLTENGEIVALIKPQFEAGRSEVGKNGVVRDAKVHADVCRRMVDFALATGYHVRGLSYSPITGPKGNIEFLLYLARCGEGEPVSELEPGQVERIVMQAHENCIK